MDLAFLGMGSFEDMIDEKIILIILKLTKYRGLYWCIALSSQICSALTFSSRSYIQTLYFQFQHATAKSNAMLGVMIDSVLDVLEPSRHLRVTGVVVGDLIDKNFRFGFDNGYWDTSYLPVKIWQEIILLIVYLLRQNQIEDLMFLIFPDLNKFFDLSYIIYVE